MQCNILSYDITSLYYIILYHIILYYVIIFHIVLYRITLTQEYGGAASPPRVGQR